MDNRQLKKTRMLNYDADSIKNLISERKWNDLDEFQKIGAVYDFVRNEILFGYNRSDLLTAEEVLADGYGQCNTKATLLMALLRAVGIPCRLHGSEVDKHFQEGVTSGLISALAPATIVHTWAEIFYKGDWIALEGVITDERYIKGIKNKYKNVKGPFARYAVSVKELSSLSLEWQGGDIFVQNESVVKDFGVYDDPDTFFMDHPQTWSKIKNIAYVHYGRKKMNRTVKEIRFREKWDRNIQREFE